jgi:hypothetical protein
MGHETKINGPINIVRMEGEIFDIHKVIYFFMEEHKDIKEQSDCNDSNSVDIVKYLQSSFENLKGDTIYDFFIEVFPDVLLFEPKELKIYNMKDSEMNYLTKLWKFFYENVKFDKNKISSLFENVRIHYIDIRSVLYYTIVDPLIYSIYQIDTKGTYASDIVPSIIWNILKFLRYMENKLRNRNFHSYNKTFVTEFRNDVEQLLLNPYFREISRKQISYLFNKLLNSYNHQSVKDFINKYVYVYTLDMLHEHIDNLYQFYNDIKKLDRKDYLDESIASSLMDVLDLFHKALFSEIARFVDLYLLRRFLDKNYITNCIVYSGAMHSASMIYMLKKFGFTITHVANHKSNIDEINKAVSNVKEFPSEKSFFELLNIFVFPDTIQCSDISTFPPNFS